MDYNSNLLNDNNNNIFWYTQNNNFKSLREQFSCSYWMLLVYKVDEIAFFFPEV